MRWSRLLLLTAVAYFTARSPSRLRRLGTAPVGSTGPMTTERPGPRHATAYRSARESMPSPRPGRPSSPGRTDAESIVRATRVRAGSKQAGNPRRVERDRHHRQGGRGRRRDEAGRRLHLDGPGTDVVKSTIRVSPTGKSSPSPRANEAVRRHRPRWRVPLDRRRPDLATHEHRAAVAAASHEPRGPRRVALRRPLQPRRLRVGRRRGEYEEEGRGGEALLPGGQRQAGLRRPRPGRCVRDRGRRARPGRNRIAACPEIKVIVRHRGERQQGLRRYARRRGLLLYPDVSRVGGGEHQGCRRRRGSWRSQSPTTRSMSPLEFQAVLSR